MDSNSIAILEDYKFSIDNSFQKMDKSMKEFEGADQSQQNMIISVMNNDLSQVKTNIGLMKMELSNLKEENNTNKWQESITTLNTKYDEYKSKMFQMKNAKNSINDDPNNIDARVDMSNMSSQQVMDRGDQILNADRDAINRMKKVVNQDLDTMKDVNKELLLQNEKLDNAHKDLKEIDYSLNRAGNQIKTMAKIFLTDKLIICMILFIVLAIIAVIISFFFNGNENTNTKYDSFNN